MGVRDFDTKIAVVVREDLPVWQKLNVTAFLTSGVVADADLAEGRTTASLSRCGPGTSSIGEQEIGKLHVTTWSRSMG